MPALSFFFYRTGSALSYTARSVRSRGKFYYHPFSHAGYHDTHSGLHIRSGKHIFTISTHTHMAKSTRNKLAGKSTGKSDSAKYFASHPDARAKKNAYNKEYHSTESRKNYRENLNKINRRDNDAGYGDGKDLSHTKSGKLVKESRSANRARNGKGSNKRTK